MALPSHPPEAHRASIRTDAVGCGWIGLDMGTRTVLVPDDRPYGRYQRGRDTAQAMSEKNMEAAKQLYPGSLDLVAALNSPETLQSVRTAFEPMVHPDFETVADPHYISAVGEAPTGTSRRVVHGIDGFIRTFSDWLEAWE